MNVPGGVDALLGALPACLVVDGAGQVVEANEAAAQLLGYPLGELVGLCVDDFVPGPARELHAVLRAGYTAAPVRAGIGQAREFLALRRDGSTLPVEIALAPLAAQDDPLVLAFVTDLSTRTAAYRSLLRSEARFRELADALPQLIWTTGPDGIADFVNLRCGEFTGIPDPGRVAEQWPSLLHPDERDEVAAQWRAAVASGSGFRAQHRLRRHDGAYRWFDTRGVVLRNPDGSVRGWCVSSDDVDDARRSTDDLRRQQERFERVAAAAPGVIFERSLLADGGSEVGFASAALDDLAGLTLDEVRADRQAYLRRIHPDDQPAVAAAFGETAETLQPSRLEYRYQHPLKGLRWIAQDVVARRDETGTVTHFGVLTDVTARHDAEYALQESEEKLRLFIDNAPAAIAMLDRDLRYIAVSRRWLTDFGLAAGDVVGVSHLELFPEIPERWRAVHRRCLAGASERAEEDRFEREDGSVLWLRWEVLPWHDATGAVAGLIIASEDITPRKRAEELALRSQKLESLGTLAGGIAHDFNNILLAIRGYTDLALRDLPEDHRARAMLGQVTRGADRATGLVQRILAFSRPVEPHREAVDLCRMATEALDLLRPTLPSLVELRTALAGGVPPVGADPGQIHQVLVNLVGNAAHAIGRHPGTVTIGVRPLGPGEQGPCVASLTGATPAGWVELSVADTGCGMDERTLAQIFDPFFSTKPAGEGTGLGLATVHAIVVAHGGSVAVTSSAGAGSCFRVLLPALASREEAAPVPARPAGAAAAAARSGSGERILVVDDEAPLVDVMTRSLAWAGFVPAGFTRAGEALAAFRADPSAWDGALLDLTMPEMTGVELARELLALRPGLPVLITSGYVPDDDRALGERVGVGGFVSKSEDISVIRGRLAELLAAARPGG